MPQPDRHQLVRDYVLDLYGRDPFAGVYEASERHRDEHGCDVYPSNPLSMRLLCVLVAALAPRRVLEVGAGLGYSALHLASAAGADVRLDTVERDPGHAEAARRHIAAAGLAKRVTVHTGAADAVLASLEGPYDLVYDDAWFMEEPAHLPRAVELLRTGGLMVTSNWFPLANAVAGGGEIDWAAQYGPDWAQRIQGYARKLASHPQLRVAFTLDPWKGFAVKTA